MELQNIIKSIDLIYYEYDPKIKRFIVGTDATKDEIFNELIKITYQLSKYDIDFYVNKEHFIVITHSKGFFAKVKNSIGGFIEKLKNQNLNIYVLSDKKVRWAKNLSLFDIKVTDKDIDISKYDTLIFTSKNGVESIEKIDKSWRKKDSYVIAPQTAKSVKRLKGNLKFVGKQKHGDEFALELLNQFDKDQKIAYIRGSRVVSSLTDILRENGFECDEIIVYETVCKKTRKIKFPKNSTFIFSSPSCVECFFKNYDWKDSYKAVCIGNTTKRYFPKEIKVEVADNTSLDSCVNKAIELNNLHH